MAVIKPVKMWVAVYPDGAMCLSHMAGTESRVRRGLADDMKQWRELEKRGWRIVQIRITPLRRGAA